MTPVLLLLFACSGKGTPPEPQPDAPAVEVAPEVEPAPEQAPDARCEDTDTKRYMGNLDECPRIRFACADGETYFSDDCGCGCETPQP